MSAVVVRALHVAFLAFAILAPFSKVKEVLVAHLLLMPFLWLHWVLNDDTCALTALEQRMRGLPSTSGSFVHSLVSPVYKVSDEEVSALAWVASVLLWLLTLRKVGWTDVREVFGL